MEHPTPHTRAVARGLYQGRCCVVSLCSVSPMVIHTTVFGRASIIHTTVFGRASMFFFGALMQFLALCFGETREIKVLCSGRSMVASLKREAIDGGPPPGVEPAAQHGKTHQV